MLTKAHLPRKSGLAILAAVFALLIASGCQRKSGSSLEAIVDQGNKHAFGFLPVHNYLPNPAGDAELTAGQQYAADLASEMLYYAMVECLSTNAMNAAEWYAGLEARAFMDQLYVNDKRELVFPYDDPEKPSAPTPCRIVNQRLLTYPVIKSALNTPYQAKSVSEGMYRLAQAFYLSLRGSYTPGDAGKPSTRLAFMPLVKMLKAQSGATAIDADKVIDDLMAMDGDFNPCEKSPAKITLTGQPQKWKTANYTCVAVSASNGALNYLPGGTLTYESVRDMVGHEIDALHDKVYNSAASASLALAGNPAALRQGLYDILTSTARPFTAAEIAGLYKDVYGPDYLLGNEDTVDTAAGAGQSLNLAAQATCGLPKTPAAVSVKRSLAGQAAASGKATKGAATAKGTTAAKGSTATKGTAAGGNGLAILAKNIQDQSRANTTADKSKGLQTNLSYANSADTQLLQKVASGQTTGMTQVAQPAGSPFVAYKDASGAQVSVNKTSGDAFVYKTGKVEGVTGSVTEVSNFPHAGTKDTDGTMGKDYVGSYLRNDGDKLELGLHVGDKSGEKNFELDTVKGKDGTFQVACTDNNQKTLDSIRDEARKADAAGDKDKAQAMNDFAQTALKYKACASGGIHLTGFALDDADGDCGGGSADEKTDTASTDDTKASDAKTDTAADGSKSSDTSTDTASTDGANSSDSKSDAAASDTTASNGSQSDEAAADDTKASSSDTADNYSPSESADSPSNATADVQAVDSANEEAKETFNSDNQLADAAQEDVNSAGNELASLGGESSYGNDSSYGNEPSYDQPSYEEPSYDQPSGEEASYDQAEYAAT